MFTECLFEWRAHSKGFFGFAIRMTASRGERGEGRSGRFTSAPSYCVNVNRTSLAHLLLGINTDTTKSVDTRIIRPSARKESPVFVVSRMRHRQESRLWSHLVSSGGQRRNEGIDPSEGPFDPASGRKPRSRIPTEERPGRWGTL